LDQNLDVDRCAITNGGKDQFDFSYTWNTYRASVTNQIKQLLDNNASIVRQDADGT